MVRAGKDSVLVITMERTLTEPPNVDYVHCEKTHSVR